MTSIGGGAFSACTSLTDVEIPGSVTQIEESAFSGCTGLTSVALEKGVKVIGHDAFFDCTSLSNVELPEGLTEIGDSAFLDCTSLDHLTIPNSVTKIGDEVVSRSATELYVYAGSAAEMYAVENAFRFLQLEAPEPPTDDTLLGDVNGDGLIDAKDASDLLVASTEKAVGHDPGLTEDQIKAADVNKDDKFDAVDASYILVYSTMKGTGKAVTFEELVAGDA